MPTLMVIDDESAICWGLCQLGEALGCRAMSASSAEQALGLLKTEKPDAIVLDVRLPGMDGLTAMRHVRELAGDHVPIVVITAFGDLDTAVAAVRQGAFEYIVKPFDLDHVERVLQRALQQRELPAPEPTAAHADPRDVLVGRSPAMQQVFTNIALAAASDASLLLIGESGTGKDRVARAVHAHSRRASGPFVAVNVAALSPALCESELFGHARGAFTGADVERRGLLEQAHGGTLFLDEVADIPLATQVKLLRALELGEVRPVGSNKAVKIDFRIISATHQELLTRVGEAAFRHDLYFRLSAFRIDIPPLRQRRDDIAALAQHFLAETASRNQQPSTGFAPATLEELAKRPWFGNVRELRNAVEHAAILARGSAIHPEHLPPPMSLGATQDTNLESSFNDLLGKWIDERLASAKEGDELHSQLLKIVEPSLFRAALQRSHGQCSAAARLLGLHRTTLKKKLEEYGIVNDDA